MKKDNMYKDLAKYYDLIYSGKDYKKEAEAITKIINKTKKTKGKDLLDVACGTGKHDQYFKKHFNVTGTDVNEEMLKIARKNVKDVTFKKADMLELKLSKKFDAITCLFSSIGYVKTYANFRKVIKGFAEHLKPGGVVIIEPWITKAKYKAGSPHLDTYEDEKTKVARVSYSGVRGNISVVDFHFTIAEEDKGLISVLDRHELGMFDTDKMLEIMKKEGFKAKSVSTTKKSGSRGLLIGVKI